MTSSFAILMPTNLRNFDIGYVSGINCVHEACLLCPRELFATVWLTYIVQSLEQSQTYPFSHDCYEAAEVPPRLPGELNYPENVTILSNNILKGLFWRQLIVFFFFFFFFF